VEQAKDGQIFSSKGPIGPESHSARSLLCWDLPGGLWPPNFRVWIYSARRLFAEP
jgi:hypothetical protein